MEKNDSLPIDARISKVMATQQSLPASHPKLGADTFIKFIDEICYPLQEKRMSEILSDAVSAEERLALVLAEIRRAPQTFQDGLIEQVKKLRRKEDAISIEDAVRLVGISNGINFLIADKFADLYKVKDLVRDAKTQMVMAAPDRVLKYAIDARKQFGEDSRYKDTAFAAGLIFDVHFLIAKEKLNAEQGARFLQVFEKTYTAAIRMTKLGIEIGKTMPALALERYLPAVVLLHVISKASYALLNTDFLSTYALVKQKGVSLTFVRMLERKTTFYESSDLASLLANTFEIFKPIASALSHVHEPQVLNAAGLKNEFEISALLFFLDRLWDSKYEDLTEKIEAAKFRPELKNFDCSVSREELKKIRGSDNQ